MVKKTGKKAVGPPNEDIIEIVIDNSGNAIPQQVHCARIDEVRWTSQTSKTWKIKFRGRTPFATNEFDATPAGGAPSERPRPGARSGSHPYNVVEKVGAVPDGHSGDIVIIP